ncbi:MAG: hypothetical protein KatS3mg076_2810 [Candidatus Binatia bacterium]|nr:MAG: hypothetical protein KatS3mg076_2810 [Candidatus Binatia bacterium]
MEPAEFVACLRRHGFDFFVGVPCSLVRGVIAELERGGEYVADTREDAALGLAAGAYLGGRKPVVLMQNSGLGVSLNALASLHLLYRIPCLLVVTWRGYGGKDAPEHLLLGTRCDELLRFLGVPYRAPEPDEVEESVSWASRVLDEERLPAALLVRPGVLG